MYPFTSSSASCGINQFSNMSRYTFPVTLSSAKKNGPNTCLLEMAQSTFTLGLSRSISIRAWGFWDPHIRVLCLLTRIKNYGVTKSPDNLYASCILVFMYSTRFSCHILLKLEYSRQIFEKYSDSRFPETTSNRSRVACGWTDGQTWRILYALFAILRTPLKMVVYIHPSE